MPVHPTEEEAPSGITEKLAKDPSSNTESTASDHPSHFNEHNPLGTGSTQIIGGDDNNSSSSGDSSKASAQDFVSKGPQMPSGGGGQGEMPAVEGSREERGRRMEELNQ